MTEEHTPLPWELGIDAENNNWSIMGGGIEITHLPFLTGSEDDDVAEADANFICRACNCHEELLKALRAAVDHIPAVDVEDCEFVDYLNAAITKATKE